MNASVNGVKLSNRPAYLRVFVLVEFVLESVVLLEDFLASLWISDFLSPDFLLSAGPSLRFLSSAFLLSDFLSLPFLSSFLSSCFLISGFLWLESSPEFDGLTGGSSFPVTTSVSVNVSFCLSISHYLSYPPVHHFRTFRLTSHLHHPRIVSTKASNGNRSQLFRIEALRIPAMACRNRLCVMRWTRSSGPWGRLQCDQGKV